MFRATGFDTESRDNWTNPVKRTDSAGILRRPHQNLNREFRLEVSCCRESLSPATRQILALTESWYKQFGSQADCD